MKPALTNKLLYIAAAVGIGYLLGVDSAEQKQVKVALKPADETCRPIDGWSAQIERTGGGDWSCVMRSEDGKRVKTFFYGGVK